MAKKKNSSHKSSSSKGSSNNGSKTTFNILLIVIVIIFGFFLIKQEYPELFEKKQTSIEMPKSTQTGEKKKENAKIDNKQPNSKEIKNSSTTQQTKTSGKEPQSQTRKEPFTVKLDEKEIAKSSGKIKFDIKNLVNIEIPLLKTDRPSQIVKHKGYTASYNRDWKISNWVAYELTAAETYGDVKRSNKFVVDPTVMKGTSATNDDYARSGYDRGHMAPAGDMTWDREAMKESFYFSNMTPQAPSLNRGIWKSLEDKSREWARRDSAICIITGPIVRKNKETIGKGKVAVPSHFFKVIFSPYTKKPQAIGFIFKNEGTLKTLPEFAVSVDSIEKVTGIDFLHILPDTMEDRVERSYDLKYWF